MRGRGRQKEAVEGEEPAEPLVAEGVLVLDHGSDDVGVLGAGHDPILPPTAAGGADPATGDHRGVDARDGDITAAVRLDQIVRLEQGLDYPPD
jgi:hypothetical protein